MGKKAVAILLAGMIVVSLAGCGAKTDATDRSPESGVVESEADDSVAGEKVGGEKGSDSGIGAEDENIVLYAEIAEYGDYCALNDFTYSSVNNILVTDTNLPVYNGDGIEVGYVKAGSSIPVTEYGDLSAWARFENPIAGTDYDYLYVLQDYVTDRKDFTLTTEEAESLIKENFNRPYYDPIFTEVTDDMELYEFRIPMYYKEDEKPLYKIWSAYDKTEVPMHSYKTYAVVCTEDTDDYIICQVYYKDLITDEEYDAYRKQQ